MNLMFVLAVGQLLIPNPPIPMIQMAMFSVTPMTVMVTVPVIRLMYGQVLRYVIQNIKCDSDDPT